MLDLLLPQRCLVCSRPGDHVCPGCRSSLDLITPPLCARCGAPTQWPVSRCRDCAGRRLAFAHARAAVPYDEPIRRVVAAWKERGLRNLAAWAGELILEAVPRPDGACIAFVPSDRERSLRRGHHAAARLADRLGAGWELPVVPLLARTQAAVRQRGLGQAARRRNVRGAFRAVAAAPPRVILVDDVYTTGATADAAASALRKAGARRVEVVTFARTIRLR